MTTVEMFHGLTAYSGRDCDAINLRQRADGCIGAEVCVADRPIGRIGVVLHGVLTHLHSQDVWSRIDSKGVRVIVDQNDTDDDGVPFVARYDQGVRTARYDGFIPCEMEQGWVNYWCRVVAPEYRTRGNYAEGWMVADKISSVWCREDANDGQYWQAKSLALKLGVAFIEIRKELCIWDYAQS